MHRSYVFNPTVVVPFNPPGRFVVPGNFAKQEQEKKMASQVKVTVPRTDLIDALQKRKDELQSESAISPELEELAKVLAGAATGIREGKHVPKGDPWYGGDDNPLKKVAKVVEEYGRGVVKGMNREQMVERIDKQLKLLGLSKDESVQIGVDDDLYELL